LCSYNRFKENKKKGNVKRRGGRKQSGRTINDIFPKLHRTKMGLPHEKKNDFGHTGDAL
jgi:hypothetical protein